MTDEEGNLVVSYVVKGYDKNAARLAVEEMKSIPKLQIEVKAYKSKRSLEQNRLLWALLGKMAVAMSGKKYTTSSEECYCMILEEANVKCDYLLALPETEQVLREQFRAIRKRREKEIDGKTFNVYQCFTGSSKFDTKEMTELIEAVLDKLAELGVYDSEIELARGEYRG